MYIYPLPRLRNSPYFDGNPLSWIDNGNSDQGNFEIAAFNVNDKCDYDSFDQIDGK
jgi:hypothetical protein